MADLLKSGFVNQLIFGMSNFVDKILRIGVLQWPMQDARAPQSLVAASFSVVNSEAISNSTF
ncbi:MAG TPA: hypothetical protein DCF63_15690 [Planctomycetaceae bacterium]|nr:hypothetical protein [Planctomycetaceae bacterium]